jgi:mRNA interferase MazF
VRGEVVRVPADKRARGTEQQGARYGVVVQSDDLLLSTVLVTPTSTASLPMVHRPEVTILGQRTCLLVEQTRAIRREALGPVVARLSLEDQQRLDEALLIALALDIS